MKMRRLLPITLAAAILTAPGAAEAKPRGGDSKGDRGGDRAKHVEQRQRFAEARRTIRKQTRERASEVSHHREHAKRVRKAVRDRHTRHDLRKEIRRRHRGDRDGFSFKISIGDRHHDRYDRRHHRRYDRPYRRHRVTTHRRYDHRPVVVEKRVVIERSPYTDSYYDPYCEPATRRRVVVRRERPIYRGADEPWEQLGRGYARNALRGFGEHASAYPHAAEPKIGYGLAAAALRDDTLAATAFRRALRADPGAVFAFDAPLRVNDTLRELEDRYDRIVRRNKYDTDAAFLLAMTRILDGEALDARDLRDGDLQMLTESDRELLGIQGGASMYAR